MILIDKIRRKWMRLRLRPIHVFCFHHVSALYDATSMNAGDWMQIDEFKETVCSLQRSGVNFISMTDMYRHLCNDVLRRKQYAVLTFDDGYASLKEILPWLEEQHIPVTLFINGKYLDGKSYRENPQERYLTYDELFALTSPLIEIGSHGWEHVKVTELLKQDFEKLMEKTVSLLSKHPRYIPFHAYTWGRHTESTDRQLAQMRIVPVLMDGMKNYSNCQCIHRELINH